MSIVGVVLLTVGLGLATVGLFGLLRKPDIFHQLHAAGLVTGPAVILVLLASIATGRAEIVTSALLVIAFVLVTSPLSTHAIARAARRRALPDVRSAARLGGPMRVLLAQDGSAGADLAAGLVAALTWPRDSIVRLVGVLEADLPPFPDRRIDGDPAPVDPGLGLDAMLEAAALPLERQDVKIERKVLRGRPATAIAEEAAAFEADLIITGTRGRRFISSLLVGSVASEVVDRAPCPVLVARAATIRRVLLATDGSPASSAATEVLARWPIFREARVRVLSVATTAPWNAPRNASLRGTDEVDVPEDAEHREIAGSAASRLIDAGVNAVAEVRAGDPATSIVDIARSQSVDLIVVGSRGRTGLKRTLLGSVARAVLYSADASVLIVRGVPSSRHADEGIGR